MVSCDTETSLLIKPAIHLAELSTLSKNKLLLLGFRLDSIV